MDRVSILGFAGSLRKGSFNRAILRAAKDLLPENATLEIFDLDGIPVFNADHEDKPTQKVRDFKAKIKAADAILIATPEYNYSIPGVLKNALDTASRPYGDNVLAGKPVAIMGASPGMLGTARAQYHLRQSFVFLDVHTLNHPEVMVAHANEKIDEHGRLTDDYTREKIADLIKNLVKLTLKLRVAEKSRKAA